MGRRLLSRRFSAPILVTAKEGKSVVLVSVFDTRLATNVKKTMRLRIVLKSPDGTLSDAAP